MRFFSIITAVIVTAALYMVVFERERLLSFADRSSPEDAEVTAPEETAEAAPEAEKDEGTRTVSVVALRLTAQAIDNAVLLRGRTEAARQVDVRAETSGLVASEPLRKGSSVEAGQLLCRIAPGSRLTSLAQVEAVVPEARARLPEAEGRVLEAEARLKEAQINDNAAKQLSADGFASEVRVAGTQASVQSALAALETARASVEGARAGIQAAEANVNAAKLEVEKLEIHAPFSGLLETDTAELGALMQPGQLCATIIQLNPIKLVAFVPETEVSKISVGATAGGRTTAGQEMRGLVTFLSRSSDPETRTFRVEITVDNEDFSLRDGQTAEILIGAEGELAHLLPSSALTLNGDGALGVQTVAEGDLAQFIEIEILRDTTEGVWVSGLPAEVAVIVTGQEYVTSGVAVRPTYQEGKS